MLKLLRQVLVGYDTGFQTTYSTGTACAKGILTEHADCPVSTERRLSLNLP